MKTRGLDETPPRAPPPPIGLITSNFGWAIFLAHGRRRVAGVVRRGAPPLSKDVPGKVFIFCEGAEVFVDIVRVDLDGRATILRGVERHAAAPCFGSASLPSNVN